MEKIVSVSGKDVRMRASALIPRLYRVKFGRDLIVDLEKLKKTYNEVAKTKGEVQFSALDLTVFENIAWLMAKQGDANIPDTPDEWLDGFEGVFSIYEALPQMIELWLDTNKTTSTLRKK